MLLVQRTHGGGLKIKASLGRPCLLVALFFGLCPSLYQCRANIELTPPVHSDAPTAPPVDGATNLCATCIQLADCDDDQLPNVIEKKAGTDPCINDSDEDGILDGKEYNSPKLCIAETEADTPRPLQWCEQDTDCPVGKCLGLDPLAKNKDGDALEDNEEDRNQDGQIGSCAYRCPAGNECAAGQTCSGGFCTPALHPRCLGAESDPRLKDTDGDGIVDDQELVAQLCDSQRNTAPKTIQSQKGGWLFAFAPTYSAGQAVTIQNSQTSEDAYTLGQGKDLVAGFVLSKPAHAYQDEQKTIVNFYQQHDWDKALVEKTLVSLGWTTYDNYGGMRFSTFYSDAATTYHFLVGPLNPTVIPTPLTVGELRDKLVSALIEHPAEDIEVPPGDGQDLYNPPTVPSQGFAFFLTMVAHQGYVIFLGGLAPAEALKDQTRETWVRLRDLTNASALHPTQNGFIKHECVSIRAKGLPAFDLIWLINDSASMMEKPNPQSTSTKLGFVKHAIEESFIIAMNVGSGARVGVMRAGCELEQLGLTGGRFTRDGAELTTWLDKLEGPGGCNSAAPIEAGKNLYAQKLSQKKVSAGSLEQGLRENTPVIYVFASDAEEYKLKELQTDEDVLGSALYNEWKEFYDTNSIGTLGMLAMKPFCPTVSRAGKHLTSKQGGGSWPICNDTEEVFTAAIQGLSSTIYGAASKDRLPRQPISSSLRLMAIGPSKEEGLEIPSSSWDGFGYDNVFESIFSFNSYTAAPYKEGDTLVLSYYYWQDAPKIDVD